ncbi:uncharacterized protein EI90DRAFT_3131988 [Cantharellus anzutake]|uniref:uncharacterized protein n=1 Tax=Cantharellus anzutake TaxID=1750568 RepID=UPI0019067EBB|nr:uncharacterized protein EI90DRAFT_3131988 [Cantharellus anzutake]KAF8320184.1 hypothetical protein EI90DRAFT_3131988 [Cantharellus anzutake]
MLGEFLVILFSNPIEFSALAKEMLKWFIGGRTVKNHPVDVVHALYNHPWARPQQSYEPPYDTLPEYAIPTMFSQPNTQMDSKNTYSDLQHYFIARVIDRMESEIRVLLKSPYLRARDTSTNQFSWDTVLDFSVDVVQKIAVSVAPVTWMLLTWIAVGGERAAQLKEMKFRDSGKGRGANHVQDPYLGCAVALMMLLYFHNKGLNKFQSIMGILMFSENSSKSLQSITGRMGLAVANSSTLKRLYSMSAVASERIRTIGANWVNKLVSFHIVYDNINQYHQNWRPSLSSQTSLESGTAATLIMQPGVAPEAFDGFEYEEHWQCVKCEDITLAKIWEDIDRKHLENTDFDDLRHTFAIHPMPLQKTEVIPLETSGFDEATTIGNRQTIWDVVEHQLRIPPHALEGRLIPFSGDQATISHIRTLKCHTSSGSTWFSSNRYILPLIELWHIKFAMLKDIIKVHWPEQTEKGDIGLHFAADKLHQNLNPNKVDFYPAERLVEVVLTAMRLNYIRNMLHQKSLKFPMRQDGKLMHLTEELEAL